MFSMIVMSNKCENIGHKGDVGNIARWRRNSTLAESRSIDEGFGQLTNVEEAQAAGVEARLVGAFEAPEELLIGPVSSTELGPVCGCVWSQPCHRECERSP
jgi:hypothetical protein